MTIKLIGCLIYQKNGDLVLGVNGGLALEVPGDLAHFKNVTMGHTVVMGRKTWESLPYKPLKGRTNIVITRTKPSKYVHVKDTYFMSFHDFKSTLPLHSSEVYYVIGGNDIYKLFMEDDVLYPTQLILTMVKRNLVTFNTDEITYFDSSAFGKYSLSGFSEQIAEHRYMYYSRNKEEHEEYKYLRLMEKILINGVKRPNRTGIDTLSLFGESLRFDISNSIPLMTTKRVPFKTIVEELLWFCRGDTDAKILQKKGIKIWDGNTSREFLDGRGLYHYPAGIIGPQYGFLWRHFGANYSSEFGDTSLFDNGIIGGADQLKYVEDLLENDPFSRRIIISAWSPHQLNEQALPSCHLLVQFYVTEENNKKHLSCMFTMRSSDALAHVFNCVSYTILTYILALKHNMTPKELIYVAGDCHIYKNHVDAIIKHLSRNPRPFPHIKLCESIKTKDWKDINVEDFELIGYYPMSGIKMDMVI